MDSQNPQAKKPVGWHSRGYLLHYDGGELAQFITFRLSDSIPLGVIEQWKQELLPEPNDQREVQLRRRVELYLDQGHGACFLRDAQIATIIEEALFHFDGQRYRLLFWVVMPNHLHLLLTPCPGHSISDILHSLKSFTSQMANRKLRRQGKFWQEDYFDRYIRDGKHFADVVAYIESNPVKAGLCSEPKDWRFSSAWWWNR
jgi:putative DNA methylase